MNEKIKRIGITLRIETIEKYDEKRDAISHDWTKFLQDSDALPIFIPNTLTDTNPISGIANDTLTIGLKGLG